MAFWGGRALHCGPCCRPLRCFDVMPDDDKKVVAGKKSLEGKKCLI